MLHTAETKTGQVRTVYLDILRIIAIVFVIFSHTHKRGFALFLSAQNSVFYFPYMAMSVISKAANPIFFMISGALLLGKEEPLSRLIKKRLKRFFIVLLTFSLMMFLYFYFEGKSNYDLNWKSFLIALYRGDIAVPYWYLYAYLIFLLMLPLLRKLVHAMTTRNYIYLFSLAALFSVLTAIDEWLSPLGIARNGSLNVPLLHLSIFFPLTGYFLANKLPPHKLTGKTVGFSVFAGLLSVVLTCFLIHFWHYRNQDWSKENREIFLATFRMFPSTGIFLGIRYLFLNMKLSSFLSRFISRLGECTFGVYLLENILRLETNFIADHLTTVLRFPAMLSCIVWILCMLIIGYAIVHILKKIPGLRSLL